jgi:hypothetical protein
MNQPGLMREPSTIERHVFAVLTEVDFPGRDQLCEALRHIQVRTLDTNGSLELIDTSPTIIGVVKQIPVEGEAVDDDGVVIHVLLHVRNGKPVELEIFKEDGSELKTVHSLQQLKAFSLPPHPSERA